MGSVTLASLLTRARSRADMPIAGFVTEVEATSWLNEGAQQVHEKLVTAYGEEYLSASASLTTIAGGLAALPASFFKLLTIETTIAGVVRSLKPYNLQERNAYRNSGLVSTNVTPSYRVVGTNIQLLPIVVGTVFTITYAPEFTLMVSPATGTTEFPNGWEKYAVAYAARQMLLKEESDVRSLDMDLARWDREFLERAESRDAAAPKSSVDIDMVDFDPLWGP